MIPFLRKFFTCILLLLFVNQIIADDITDLPEFNEGEVQVQMTNIIVKGIEADITVSFKNQEFIRNFEGYPVTIIVNNKPVFARVVKGNANFKYQFKEDQNFEIKVSNYTYTKKITPIPLWFSIIPPLIAILFALIFKEVFTALFIGILVGTATIFWYQDTSLIPAIFKGLFAIIDTYILDSLTEPGHMSIIVFSMLIGAMVNIITRNGGMKGIVNILSKYANNPRSGQFITWLLGIAIFFDDYANTLVVGNTMRPVTDKLKISREKLAYIVDSTAAPITAIAFVTTWIGSRT